MKRSHGAIGAGVLAAVGAAAWALWPSGPPPDPPANVVLIVVDTLRADRLGAWGHPHPTSPRIDALASEGIRFSQATSQAPWTTPSVAALMTSQYPASLGITSERSALPDEATTLAEVLRASGRATGAVVSHTFCSSDWRFDQGFDAFDEANIAGHHAASSAGVTDAGLAFLDEHQGEPFFLWLHYFDPHFAYLLHPDHDVAPTQDYDGTVVSGMPIPDLNRLRRAGMDPADLAEIERFYDSEIAWTDHQIGRILDRLADLGIRDDTMVILTADHGEEFLDHGLLGHGKTLYQELVHVPLIIDCPWWRPGVVEQPVANVDVFPTVLACLDQPIPEGLVGQALGPDPPNHLVFSQTAKKRKLAMVREGDLTVIAHLKGERPRFEMYDLAEDPGQRRDLARQGGRDLERLARRVLELQAASESLLAPPVQVEVDPSLQEQLEQLGYVGE